MTIRKFQEALRRYLLQPMTDSEREIACIPVKPGTTRWECLLEIYENKGKHVPQHPEE